MIFFLENSVNFKIHYEIQSFYEQINLKLLKRLRSTFMNVVGNIKKFVFYLVLYKTQEYKIVFSEIASEGLNLLRERRNCLRQGKTNCMDQRTNPSQF